MKLTNQFAIVVIGLFAVIAGALEVTDASAGTSESVPDDLNRFIQEQWDHEQGQNAIAWTNDFSSEVDYCYVNGHPRDMLQAILRDHEKLLERWPRREYSSLDNQIQMLSDDSAAISCSFDYTYQGSGGQSARGRCQRFLWVSKLNGRWQITQFDEQVERY